MLKMETEARDAIHSIQSTVPTCKEDVRRVLLQRKLDNLLELRRILKPLEGKAVSLMRRVDYSRFRPRLAYVNSDDVPLWRYFRHVVSSAPFQARPYRCLLYWCYDEISGGILGIIDVGSEMQTIGPRDRYIGWTKSQKFGDGLRRIANVGTCVCVHPFGLLTGGKFQLVACTSTRVVDDWRRRYGDVLGAVATTSLYGKSSVYNRLKEFKYLGNTPGQSVANLTNEVYRTLREFLRVNYIVARATGFGHPTVNRAETLNKCCAVLSIDRQSLSAHQPRGCYFGELGADALRWLRGEVSEFTPQTRSVETIADWWAGRWGSPRWSSQREIIERFDYRTYFVDNQIEICKVAIREGSADSGTADDQSAGG